MIWSTYNLEVFVVSMLMLYTYQKALTPLKNVDREILLLIEEIDTMSIYGIGCSYM